MSQDAALYIYTVYARNWVDIKIVCSLPRGRHLSIPTEKHGPRVQWPRIVRPPSELCRYTLLPRLLRYIEWTSYLLIFILNTRTRNSHGQLHCTGLQRQIESSWIVYSSIKQISCPRPYYALFFLQHGRPWNNYEPGSNSFASITGASGHSARNYQNYNKSSQLLCCFFFRASGYGLP